MTEHRKMLRCIGCGKWTRRSRCSICRAERKRAAAIAQPGRIQRQAERQRKATQGGKK